jgi:hypothetical protein
MFVTVTNIFTGKARVCLSGSPFSDFNLCVGPEPRLDWSDIDQHTMLLERIIKYAL